MTLIKGRVMPRRNTKEAFELYQIRKTWCSVCLGEPTGLKTDQWCLCTLPECELPLQLCERHLRDGLEQLCLKKP